MQTGSNRPAYEQIYFVPVGLTRPGLRGRVVEGGGRLINAVADWSPVFFRALAAAPSLPAASVSQLRFLGWKRSAVGDGTVRLRYRTA